MSTRTLVNRALLTASLSLLLSGQGSAADAVPITPQVEALQQRVAELEARIERLEAQMARGAPVNPALKVKPVPGGWRTASNWELLVKGQTDRDVEEILGTAQNRKKVNKFEFWEYGSGMVRFYLGRLKSWELPKGFD